MLSVTVFLGLYGNENFLLHFCCPQNASWTIWWSELNAGFRGIRKYQGTNGTKFTRKKIGINLTNSTCSFLGILFDKMDNLCFLCRRATTAHHSRALASQLHKLSWIELQADLKEIKQGGSLGKLVLHFRLNISAENIRRNIKQNSRKHKANNSTLICPFCLLCCYRTIKTEEMARK